MRYEVGRDAMRRRAMEGTSLSFLGGVGVIGGTKVLIESGGWRVLLDLGSGIPASGDLMAGPGAPRPGSELAIRRALGEAPDVPGLYRTSAVREASGRLAVFLSHAHLDHVGLVGWVDPAVPVFASPDTVHLLRARGTAGEVLEGDPPALRPLDAGQPVDFGPFRIVRYDVDHDVPGASGYAVHTPDGVLAYSGDLRRHGRHPELTDAFAETVRGAQALVLEGTTLGGPADLAYRDEATVDRLFAEALERTPGLVLLSLYPMNVERVVAFGEIARAHGRRILWPARMQRFLHALGHVGVESWPTPELSAAPGRFVVQIDPHNLSEISQLPLTGGDRFLHANGEPLGPFQAGWDVLHGWLRRLGVPFQSIGTSGHALADDLHRLVAMVDPEVLYPVHTTDPYRLAPPPGTLRIVPVRGRTYPLRRAELLGRGASRPLPSERADFDGAGRLDTGRGLPPPRDSRPVVCVDLDSTLCDTRHRRHLVRVESGEAPDWQVYSMACGDDPPVVGVLRAVQLLAATHEIVVVSARDRAARDLTVEWLARHAVPYRDLVLGGGPDAPADVVDFKVHHLRRLQTAGYEVALLVDDLVPVVEACRPLGIPVLSVRPPVDFELPEAESSEAEAESPTAELAGSELPGSELPGTELPGSEPPEAPVPEESRPTAIATECNRPTSGHDI